MLMSVIHNCIVHPLLPLAETLEWLGFYRAAEAINWLHDLTVY